MQVARELVGRDGRAAAPGSGEGPRSPGVPATRRGLLRGMAGLLALGAAGCGFRPVYGPGGGAAAEDAAIARELAAMRVPVIPERFGQLMRRRLEQRLTTASDPVPAKWELQVAPVVQADALGVLRTGEATRVRYIATANWSLVRLTPRETVANGFERAVDAYNIERSQFFAADSSREAAERRLADQLAEEVVLRVAMRLRSIQEGHSLPGLIDPVAVPPPLPDTSTLPPARGGLLDPALPGSLGGGLGGGIGGGGVLR